MSEFGGSSLQQRSNAPSWHGRLARADVGCASDEVQGQDARATKAAGRRAAIVAGVIGLITFALYARSITFGYVNFDDSAQIPLNPHLALGLSRAGLRWAWTNHDPYWTPLTETLQLVIYSCVGSQPWAYHLVNALLFAGSAALLMLLWLRTTGAWQASAAATALWAWHPLRVESVAWLAETKDVLACFFCIGTCLLYVRFVRRRGWGGYLLVLLAFALALCSKPSVVALPFGLMLLDAWPLRRWGVSAEADRRLIIEKLPLIAIAAGFSVGLYLAQKSTGAVGGVPLGVRVENALVSYAVYLRQTFWPAGLCIFYPHPYTLRQVIPFWQWGGAIALLGLISGLVLWCRKAQPAAAVGWFWFLGMLVPMIGLVQVGLQARGDRFTLVPSIVLMAAIVWPAARVVGRWRGAARAAMSGLLVLLLAGECLATERQLGFWRDEHAAFAHANAVTRDNYLAEAVLSEEVAGSAQPAERRLALQLAQAADRAYPASPDVREALARAEEVNGDLADAAMNYRRLMADLPTDPAYPKALGQLLVQQGRYDLAMAAFRRALQLTPSDYVTRHNLALCLAHQRQFDAAIRQWQRVLHEDPGYGPAQGELGQLLLLLGRPEEAVPHLRAAVAAGEHDPVWETNLAWLMATDPASSPDQLQQALMAAEDACRQRGQSDALALDAEAAVLARVGRYDDAATTAERALQAAAGRPGLQQQIERRRQIYLAGQAYLAPSH